jgi:beta-lactamase regulating signal transducer with metallopeptidase domain
MLVVVGGTWFVSTPFLDSVKASPSVIDIISSDTTWTRANSPYTATEPVAVTDQTGSQALSQLETQAIVIVALVVVVVVLSIILIGMHMRSRAEKQKQLTSLPK